MVRYRTAAVDGHQVFYREAGDAERTLLLLHGFPTSSQMFRELIPRLSDRFHLIAPDYPGYGYSAAPPQSEFAYTFDNYARLIDRLTQHLELNAYALYVMDYGEPVGFRIAAANPNKVMALNLQNGNAYEEGIAAFWGPIKDYWKTGAKREREAIRWLTSIKATKWQYTNGVKDVSLVSPDAWT